MPETIIKDRVLEEQQQQERNEAMVSHWGDHGDIITEDDIELWIKAKEEHDKRSLNHSINIS